MQKEELTNTQLVLTNVVSVVYRKYLVMSSLANKKKRENVLTNYHYLIQEKASIIRKRIVLFLLSLNANIIT